MKNVTLVIGASKNPKRYSYMAINKLRAKELEVVAIGLRKAKVVDVAIGIEKIPFSNIDTITLYLNAKRQNEYYDYIISLKPRRVIFNPGTENNEFVKLLKVNGIVSEIACTLVLLSTNQY